MTNQAMASNSYEAELVELIESNERVMTLLRAVASLNLDQWCIAAGTIRNLVWDHLHGHDHPTLPTDIDVLIYDSHRTSPEYEQQLQAQLGQLVGEVEWEVVNQATIHTYTGDAEPYTSITDAMSRWADLVTAIGAWIDQRNAVQIVAPAGLHDLFELHVRPNIATPTAAAVYQQRMASKGWKQRWPKLTIHGLGQT